MRGLSVHVVNNEEEAFTKFFEVVLFIYGMYITEFYVHTTNTQYHSDYQTFHGENNDLQELRLVMVK